MEATFDAAGEVDASSLAAGFGLDNERLGLALLPHIVVSLQFGIVLRQVPGDWEELVLPGEVFPKMHQRISKVVLPRQNGHP